MFVYDLLLGLMMDISLPYMTKSYQPVLVLKLFLCFFFIYSVCALFHM